MVNFGGPGGSGLRAVGRECAANAGRRKLSRLGTPNVVCDLDRIRAALGDRRLTHDGLSHGTRIGASHAGYLPHRSYRRRSDSGDELVVGRSDAVGGGRFQVVILPPVLADVTAYNLGLFVHVLAVVAGFGPMFAYGVFIGFAEARAPASTPAVLRAMNMTNRFLVTPAMIMVLAAGIYLMAKGDYDAGDSWISVGFAAIILLFGLVHGFFLPQGRKAVDMAERDLAGGGELGAGYRALSARIARVGQLAGLIVIVAIFFMVVKP